MQENKKIVFEGYSRRLDIFAADELADFSRAIVQKMIKDGKITVNGKKVKPSWPLTPGEVVEIEMPAPKAKTKLSDLIIHDGKDFFVLIKPAGMLVHPQSPVWEEHPEAVFSTEETLVSVILANPPKGFDTSMPRAGAACARVKFNVGKSVFAFQYLVIGNGFAPYVGSLDFASGYTPYRHVNSALVIGHFAAGDGVVCFVNLPVGKQSHHFGLKFLCFGYHHYTAGFAKTV